MRKLFEALAFTATAVFASGTAAASTNYPERPVRIIVPYQAGQGTDIATRYFADHLSKVFGQSFIVENMGGAGGNIGTQAAARADADGYTLTMGTNATHVLNEFMYSSLSFDPVKDFEPVVLTGTLPMVLIASANSRFQTMQQIFESVKESEHSADIGTPSTTARLAFELLKEQSGTPLYMIPYKGSSMSMTNVMGGQIPLAIDTITASRPQIEGEKLRAIGVTSSQRTELHPGIPTVAEQGLPEFEVVAWNALYAPQGTPKEIITKLNQAVQDFLALPETRERLHSMGYEPGGGSPDDLAAFAAEERSKWGPIIEKANLKVQ